MCGCIDNVAGFYVRMLFGDATLDMYLGAVHYGIFMHRNITTHFVDTLFVFHILQNILTTFVIHGIFFEKLVVVHM